MMEEKQPRAKQIIDIDANASQICFYALPFSLTQEPQPCLYEKPVSSTGGSTCLLVLRHTDHDEEYGIKSDPDILLLRADYTQNLMPEMQYEIQVASQTILSTASWKVATFDERERIWLCSKRGDLVVILSSNKQHKHSFELKGFLLNNKPLGDPLHDPIIVKSLAAYDNQLAIVEEVYGDRCISIYHCEGNSLEMLTTLKDSNQKKNINIKPDTTNGGWWVVTRNEMREIYQIEHLSATADRLEKITKVPYYPKVLGAWPDETYFMYVDKDHLHYTLDPSIGWQQVLLKNTLSTHHEEPVTPIDLHKIGNSVFLWGTDSKTNLLIQLEPDDARLISAFRFSHETRLLRWGTSLLLYSDRPLVLAPEYAKCTQVNKIPENKRLLFYYPELDSFHAELYVPYSGMKALYQQIITQAKGGQKLSEILK